MLTPRTTKSCSVVNIERKIIDICNIACTFIEYKYTDCKVERIVRPVLYKLPVTILYIVLISRTSRG